MSEGSVQLPSENLLSEKNKRIINDNWYYLICNIQPGPLLDKLHAEKVIVRDWYNEIKSATFRTEQNVRFLDKLKVSSQNLYYRVIETLAQTNQQAVADILSEHVQRQPNQLCDRFGSYYDIIVDNLRYEDGLLSWLEGYGVLTRKTAHDLQCISPRRSRSSALLADMKLGSTELIQDGLINALTVTKQAHLANLILHDDFSHIVPKQVRDAASQWTPELVEFWLFRRSEDIPLFLLCLVDQGVITNIQEELILGQKSCLEQAEVLVEVLLCRPYTEQTREILDSVDSLRQDHVYGYSRQLRAYWLVEVPKLSHQLNEELCISEIKMGTFHSKLSIAVESKERRQKELLIPTEEYIRRNPGNMTCDQVEVQNIFDSLELGEPQSRRVLMLGAAGAGKTTTALQVTYEWASGKLWKDKFELSFLFLCRRFLKHIKQKRRFSLGDLLFSFQGLGCTVPIEKELFVDNICHSQYKVLITLDGLDELAGWRELSESAPPIVTNIRHEDEIPVIIYNLISGHLLPNARVLVTSRPNKAANRNLFHKTVVLLGFSRKSIQQCMKGICSGDTKTSQKIMDHITIKTQLYIHCGLPLACVFIGVIIRQSITDNESCQIATLTHVFIGLVLLVIHRRADLPASRFALTEGQRDTLKKLSALASYGMYGEHIDVLFDEEDMIRFEINDQDMGSGLMDVSKYRPPTLRFESTSVTRASFLHLVIQEFLAAVHTVLAWEGAGRRNMAMCGGSERLRMTQLFVSGLLGDSFNHKFIQAIMPEVSGDMLAVRFEEFGRLLLSPETTDGNTRVHILSCLHEGKFVKYNHDLHDVEKWGILDNANVLNLNSISGGILPHQVAALSYFLDLTCVTRLDLNGNAINAEGAGILADSLKRNSSVTILRLSSNAIGPEGCRHLSKSLDKNKSLEQLYLPGNAIGAEGARYIGEALRTNATLTSMSIGANFIGDEGTRYIAEGLKDNTSLQKIYLQSNSIGDVGIWRLEQSLEYNKGLYEIDLAYNEITDQGAKCIGSCLQKQKRLQQIRLEGNNLSVNAMIHLSEEFANRIWVGEDEYV